MQKKLVMPLLGVFFIPITVLLTTFVVTRRLDAPLYVGVSRELPKHSVETEEKKDISNFSRDELLLEMDEIYSFLSNDISEYQEAMDNIAQQYQVSKDAIVCSDANRAFNSLEESYNSFAILYDEITSNFELYEECYNKLQSKIVLSPEDIAKSIPELKTRTQDMEKLEQMYLEAKQKADDMFEEYYDPMCHIVYAEAGERKCSEEERYYVANVIENRVKHKNYPSTITAVINQPGQYEPVENGRINQTPSQAVRKQVEDYLRGRIETGMPDNVLFQSLYEQGSGTWKAMSSGHYFCFK